jgi:hypothetical protein
MRFSRLWLQLDYGLAADGVVFDPGTMLAIGTTAAGTIAGAAGSMMSGSAAQEGAQYQAAQMRENEAGAIAAGQRNMFDTQHKTRLAISSTTARAAAGGVNAAVGSPATTAGDLASRGSYLAATDLFRGENEATGLENQARGVVFTGNAQKTASDISAFGTIAGGVGSMAQQYGRYAYPGAGGRSPTIGLDGLPAIR